MASSLPRGILVLGSVAFVVLGNFGDAFVTKQFTTRSSLAATKFHKHPHLPVNHFRNQQHSSSFKLMATDPDADKSKSSGGLPFWLDPGTRGGAVVLSLLLFVLPLVGYSVATTFFGVDGVEAGNYIGVGFTAIATLVWVFTYIFRVATKDMTYAKQLKDYENAVIAKRLEELDDDEIQALVEEIERDEF
jgi:hypothetical protein